jgi:hypothetical protein
MIFHNSRAGITATGILAMAFLAIMAGCASHGQTESTDGSTAMNAVAEDEQPEKKLVCRRIKPTGSRMGERICMRPEQWEKYAGHGQKTLDRVQRRALTTNDQGG